MNPRWGLLAIVVAPLLSLSSGCAQGSPAASREASDVRPGVTLVPCFVEGVRAPARCGKVRVFEDRAAKKGRTIDLQVVVIPALASPAAEDPVFFLAGGPGQSATQIAGFSLAEADRLHERRDFVFVDQRGTGASGGLYCDALPPDAPLADRYDSGFDEQSIDLCLAGLDADLTKYTTSVAVDDLDDVRAALGYGQINLWGTSYGTRVALAYLRAHGARARSVVLDSVAPMSLYLQVSAAKDAQRALDRLLADCAAEPACGAAFPDLGGRLRAFLDRLENEPIRATLTHPVSGAREDVTLDRQHFLGALRGLLYTPDLSALLPLALDRAIKGDLSAFLALATELQDGFDRSMATGMFLSVVCSEDVPFYRREDVVRESAATLFGAKDALEMMDGCARWPRADVPRSFRDPVESDVPVLLLSGDLDPVTPPSWAEDAKKTLRRSASVVFTGTAHTAATSACARRIAARFVDSGSERDLDTACASKIARPPFFTTFAGAP